MYLASHRGMSVRSCFLALFLSPGPVFSSEPYVLNDFSGGLNTWRNPLTLKDNESPALQNVLLDERLGITRREGYRAINATTIGGGATAVNAVYQFEASGGTDYCVAFSSTNGYSSTDACATFTSFISTLTRNNDVNCDSLQDRLYCVNNQYSFYFDGTNDIAITGPPTSTDFIRVHRNRCFLAGATGNLSRLYYSAIGDCNSWTTGTDFIDVSPEDGDIITGIGPPLYDMLPVYKKFSTWALKGSGPSTWVLINISNSIGAKNHRSIDNYRSVQLFDSVGANGGKPGIYAFNGIVVEEVSKNLRNEITISDTFRQAGNQRILDKRADWDAATFDPFTMSSAREPGFMQSTYTAVSDTIGSDWADGTFDNISTSSLPGSLVVVQGSSAAFINAGAESNSTTLNWTFDADATITAISASPILGSYSFQAGCDNDCGKTVFIRVRDAATDNLLVTRAIVAADGENLQDSIDTAQYTSSMVYITIGRSEFSATCDAGADELYARSQPFLRGRNIWFGYKDNNTSSTQCRDVFDFDESLIITSGTFTSSVIDLAISTPIWGIASVIMSSAANCDIDFAIRTATSSSGVWSSYTDITNGSELTNTPRRFSQYRATYTHSASTNACRIDSADFSAASTGTWTSNELLLSLNISASGWGLFQTDQTTTGSEASLAYLIQIATYSGGAQYADEIVVTRDTAISASTGAYVIVKATATVGVATETAKINSIMISWSEGTQATSSSGKVFRDRYHYAAQSKDGTRNDIMYVLDGNGAWTKWTGVRPRHLNVVNQEFIMADSSTSSGGYAFELYDTDSDNGTAINAFWESRDLPFNGIHKIKAVDRIYTMHSSDDTTITMTLKSDGGLRSSDYSLNLSTASTFGIRQTVVEPAITGNTMRLRYSNNATSAPWEILGVMIYFRDLGLMP